MSRLLTAGVAVPLLLAILLLGPDWLFFALALIVAALGYWELGALMKSSGQDLLGAGFLTVLLVTSAFYFEPLTLTHATLASILVIGGAVVFQWSPSRDRLAGAMGTFFATFYVGALMGSIVALRTLGRLPIASASSSVRNSRVRSSCVRCPTVGPIRVTKIRSDPIPWI